MIKDTRIELSRCRADRDGIRSNSKNKRNMVPECPSGALRSPFRKSTAASNDLRRQIDELLRKYTNNIRTWSQSSACWFSSTRIGSSRSKPETKAAEDDPGNPFAGDPVAQQLKVALNDAEQNLTTVRARLGEYDARYNYLRSSAESLPKIDIEYTQLNRDYDMQKRQYESLVLKRETASLTGKLEECGGSGVPDHRPAARDAQSGCPESLAAARRWLLQFRCWPGLCRELARESDTSHVP